MQSEIIRKLTEQLGAGITSEVQVVYLMAGIRKLLEQQQATKQYEYLMFHCDWTLHSKLDRASAQRILKLFDDANIHLSAGGKLQGLPSELRKELGRISNMKPFEEELGRFLQQNDLPSLNAVRPDGWTHFLHLYARVVEDCPLVIRGANSKSATIADVTVHVERANRSVANQMFYSVSWTIKDRNGRTGSVVVVNSFSLDPSLPSPLAEVARSTTSLGWSTAKRKPTALSITPQKRLPTPE